MELIAEDESKLLEYRIYFEKMSIEVDDDGVLDYRTEDNLYIVEYDEYGNFIRRIDQKGNEIEMDIPVESLYDNDMIEIENWCETIQEALNELDEWLEMHTLWKETLRQTYYLPAEYVCVGIDWDW